MRSSASRFIPPPGLKIEFPRAIVAQQFGTFLRPGQDPCMRKLVEMLINSFSMTEEKNISASNLNTALVTCCLSLGIESSIANRLKELLVQRVSTANHPEAAKFSEAVRAESRFWNEGRYRDGKKRRAS